VRPADILAAACSAVLAFDGNAFAQLTSFARSDIATVLTLTNGVIAGDFNGDGMPDLLVTLRSSLHLRAPQFARPT
jgi:hypothetical protein